MVCLTEPIPANYPESFSSAEPIGVSPFLLEEYELTRNSNFGQNHGQF